jgi:hypothetical protein
MIVNIFSLDMSAMVGIILKGELHSTDLPRWIDQEDTNATDIYKQSTPHFIRIVESWPEKAIWILEYIANHADYICIMESEYQSTSQEFIHVSI